MSANTKTLSNETLSLQDDKIIKTIEWYNYEKHKPDRNSWCLVAVKRNNEIFTITGTTFIFYSDNFYYHSKVNYQDVKFNENVVFWAYLPNPI